MHLVNPITEPQALLRYIDLKLAALGCERAVRL